MYYLILILIGLLGVYLGVFLARKKISKSDPLQKARQARKDKKEKAKQQIFQLFHTKEQITNNDVEELLQVSDATACNYLQELKQEGQIQQQGQTGRNVYYTKTPK